MQYTIHFINECDLFIRKMQQKYQIKQIPLGNDPCSSTTISSLASVYNPQPSKSSNTIVSAFNMNRVSTRSSARLASAASSVNNTTGNCVASASAKPTSSYGRKTSSNSLKTTVKSESETSIAPNNLVKCKSANYLEESELRANNFKQTSWVNRF